MKLILALTSLVLLSSCGQAVEDFVRGAKPPSNLVDPPKAGPVSSKSPMSLKIGPRMEGTGSGMAVKGTVTTTDKKFQMGPDMAVQLTLSRTRVNPL
jgi:hypothetical protein